MVAGHLQEKNNFYYIVLSYKDANGKRKTKWEATGLSVTCCVLYAAIIPPFPAICKPLAAHSAFWIFRDSDRLKILCTMHNKAH